MIDDVRELPTGTVTFLFTDIEGSTRLLQELGDGYADALAEHRRLLREAFARHGGVEVDTQGDAFFVAFAAAADAAAAAQEGRRALEAGQVRVRIGIHTGAPTVTEEGYVGLDVHRAARICATAHGGQIVLSEGTRALLGDGLPLKDLGLHRLKDLAEPVKLLQLGDGEFPPLRSLNATNLPTQPTPLVGRERELAEVIALLGSARLVTLTGAGGSGKTRLALQAAAELVDEFKDGVFWVSLAALRNPELVLPTIGAAVGTKEDLARFVDEKRMLLLLDNLEQILASAPALANLLRLCPNLKLLTTSRAPLRIGGEQEYEVPPLPGPEAVELFTQRASQVRPGFDPDEEVAEICQRLDGLPLALELAAARVKLLSPEQILERLEHRLELLTAGAREAPERQQTLRATIEWSYELLNGEEKQLFAHLAVFAGSFDLRAAEHVCEADIDLLGSLVDKSLLRRTEERFFILETIREYADERLVASGSERASRNRHARYFLELVPPSEEALIGVEAAEWMARLRADNDNLHRALVWSFGEGEREIGVRLTGSLVPFWWFDGRWAEGRHWLEYALPISESMPDDARRLVLNGAGELARFEGDYDRAVALKEQLLEFQRSLGLEQDWLTAAILSDLAQIAAEQRQFGRARKLNEEAIATRHALGDSSGIAHALHGAGEAAMAEGCWEEARVFLEEALERSLDLGQRYAPAIRLHSLGELARRQGKLVEAISRYRESLELGFDLGSGIFIAADLEGLAAVAAEQDKGLAAARLWGAAEILYEQGGARYDYPVEHERAVARAKRSARPEEFKAAWAEGREMSAEEAVTHGLAELRAEPLTARVDR
jgi:predicted ATPase/class 3 adenylate cyclase